MENIPSPPSPETIPLPPQSSTSSRLFLISVIVGILLLILLVLGGYYLASRADRTRELITKPTIYPYVSVPIQPTKDPVINWKTYENEQYGFSFQYPSHDDRGTLSVVTFSDNNFSNPLRGELNLSVAYMNSDVFLLNIAVFKSNLSEAEWWNNIGNSKYNQLVKQAHDAMQPTTGEVRLPNFSTSHTIIGGKETLVERGNLALNQGGGITTITIVSDNGYVYLFEQPEEMFPGVLLKSSAILSTFKFLDHNETSDYYTWPVKTVCFPGPVQPENATIKDLGDGTYIYKDKDGTIYRGYGNMCE